MYKNIVSSVVNNIKDNDKITVGKNIRLIHSISPYVLVGILLFCSKNQAIFVIFLHFIICMVFIINGNRCILSSIENKLLKDNILITDIYLKYLDLDPTWEHRIILTIFGFSLHGYLIFAIYYYKFLR